LIQLSAVYRFMFLEILQSITGIFVVVYDGQHALKFTLGRAQEVVGPGVHFKLPIVQSFRVEETKDTTIDLEPQTIQLKDDLVYEVGAKVVYQIVDLRKAMIEVDDLQRGLKNRLVLAVQKAVNAQDRRSIREMDAMIAVVRRELAPVEEQWGFTIHEFGFSTFSPTPETLEVTQLQRLAEEKLSLFQQFRREGLTEQAAVSLISGAVVAIPSRDNDRPSNVEGDGRSAALAGAAGSSGAESAPNVNAAT
jgi:regulator of protease activity HflC (stomatin/prohibitin superfamily)